MPQSIRHHKPTVRLRVDTADTSPNDLARLIGPVVYFIRARDDSIKIGFTKDLARRRVAFGPWSCVMAFYRGVQADEADEHDEFRPWSIGHEFYRPNRPLLARINELRAGYGMPPVEPWLYRGAGPVG